MFLIPKWSMMLVHATPVLTSQCIEELQMSTFHQIFLKNIPRQILKDRSPELDPALHSLCMLKNIMEKHGTISAKECINAVLQALPARLCAHCTWTQNILFN